MRASKTTQPTFVVLVGDEVEKSFVGPDAKQKAKEYADKIAEENTTGRPMGYPEIAQVTVTYGRNR